MQRQQRFDLVLKGGRVIDPAQGLDGVQDVAIADGKIAAIGQDISAGDGAETVDVRGALVLPGLIDTHAHVYPAMSPAGSGSTPIWSACIRA